MLHLWAIANVHLNFIVQLTVIFLFPSVDQFEFENNKIIEQFLSADLGLLYMSEGETEVSIEQRWCRYNLLALPSFMIANYSEMQP